MKSEHKQAELNQANPNKTNPKPSGRNQAKKNPAGLNPEKLNPAGLNTVALAFMGDAVYERYVREYVIAKGIRHADELHKAAVGYVRAESQAYAARVLMESVLTDGETAILKRARNRKNTASKRAKAGKNGSDPMNDKLATAFEALIGYLYLAGEKERLEELMNIAIRAVEDRAKNNSLK